MRPTAALVGGDDLARLVRALEAKFSAEMTELRARVAVLEERRGSTLSRADRDLLGRLLPAIGGSLGSDIFAVKALYRVAAVVAVLGLLSSKSLGRLLLRAADRDIGGYCVECVGRENGALLWRVVKVVF